jgi:hypothetical protein
MRLPLFTKKKNAPTFSFVFALAETIKKKKEKRKKKRSTASSILKLNKLRN